MDITTGGKELLPQLLPLWNALKQHHVQVAGVFSSVFAMGDWETRSEDLQRKAFDNKLKVDLVTGDNELMAFAVSTITEKGVGEIDSLYVKEQCRGQGIGKQLIQRALDWMKAEGAVSYTLRVVHGNDRAMSLYQSLGFFPIIHTLMIPQQTMIDSDRGH
ncbi:MAG: GNAT family N-acetyltransferase [Syntrophomonadaceae bacterium]|nr:GNAT family N-acetyltransferase [Syntrophomonadaceae bacterium]